MTQPVIQVKNLSKCYQIRSTIQKPYHSLREDLVDGLKGLLQGKWQQGKTEDFWALKDINFDVNQGEIVGIIGSNGAGKSTLLKILSRIVKPTNGEVKIIGRIGSLLEVGTGFHPELTGRENIFMNGSVLGMKRAEIKKRFDEIIDFAEVEKFLDTPVKFYSSGMYVRLAFAVAAHLEPEILIVDEVLAVGDAAFQKKCLGKMENVANKEGRTILFVSHSMTTIKSLCENVILISDGNIIDKGDPYTITNLYFNQMAEEHYTKLDFQENHSLKIQFLFAELSDSLNERNEEVVLFRCRYVVHQESDNTMLCVEVQNISNEVIFYSNDDSVGASQNRKIGYHSACLIIPKYLLAAGDYYVAFGFWEPSHNPEHFPDKRLFFHRDEPVNRLSKHGIHWPGLLYLPNSWEYSSTSK
jgi:ABC-type polysaccharide/polyol phosphate transport system ATPase subunit